MTLNLVFLMHSLQLHLNAATSMSVSLMVIYVGLKQSDDEDCHLHRARNLSVLPSLAVKVGEQFFVLFVVSGDAWCHSQGDMIKTLDSGACLKSLLYCAASGAVAIAIGHALRSSCASSVFHCRIAATVVCQAHHSDLRV